MSGCCSTQEDLAGLEERIAKEVSAYGRRLYAEAIQKLSDEMPHTGSDGVMLSKGRTVGRSLMTPYGEVELTRLSTFDAKPQHPLGFLRRTWKDGSRSSQTRIRPKSSCKNAPTSVNMQTIWTMTGTHCLGFQLAVARWNRNAPRTKIDSSDADSSGLKRALQLLRRFTCVT